MRIPAVSFGLVLFYVPLILALNAYDSVRLALSRVIVPLKLWCPACGCPHRDRAEWRHRVHRTHRCVACRYEWRPFPFATRGT